jgi:hypothetical protein
MAVLTEKDFPFPTDRQLRQEIENDLRRITREEGCERIGVLDARRDRDERRSQLKILGLPEEQIEAIVARPFGGPIKEAKPEKPKKEPKQKAPKKAGKPDGYITITELCTKWGIKPLHARGCLRASDLEKPEFGWAFSPKDVPKIKKICGVK